MKLTKIDISQAYVIEGHKTQGLVARDSASVDSDDTSANSGDGTIPSLGRYHEGSYATSDNSEHTLDGTSMALTTIDKTEQFSLDVDDASADGSVELKGLQVVIQNENVPKKEEKPEFWESAITTSSNISQ